MNPDSTSAYVWAVRITEVSLNAFIYKSIQNLADPDMNTTIPTDSIQYD